LKNEGAFLMRAARHACSLVLWAATLMLIVGCGKSDPTVWTEDVPSPDGRWIATAAAYQTGGFGSANIWAVVNLRRRGETARTTILALIPSGPIKRPYVLDNIANRGGSVDLTLRWIDPTHLQITFRNYPGVMRAETRVGDISISTENLSGQ
jgi:hypothetical protein